MQKILPLKVSCILIILTEAVVQRCSVKEGFFEISKIDRKTPVPESPF